MLQTEVKTVGPSQKPGTRRIVGAMVERGIGEGPQLKIGNGAGRVMKRARLILKAVSGGATWLKRSFRRGYPSRAGDCDWFPLALEDPVSVGVSNRSR
jgi:hypothetical protein